MVESLSTARIPDGTPRPMRFAYADPPYPGQAKRWYGNHPDYAGEVDHAELVERLCRDYPDGWALSTSARALPAVLALCPQDVGIGVWHITNAEPPGNRPGRWWWCWEPVIVRGGRIGPVKNLLSCGAPTGFLGNKLPGQKPPRFTRWVAELLGATPDDQIDDLFPGSGAVGLELAMFFAQPMLEQIPEPSPAAPGTLL